MKRFTILLTLFFIEPAPAQENAPDPALARMREGMKKLVQRISEADAARVAADAAKAEADLKVADLEAKLKLAEKKTSDLEVKATKERAISEKTIGDLNTQVVERDKQIQRLNEALAKWKEGFNQAKTIAEGKEAERAAAAGKSIVLERRVSAAEAKNAEMHKLAMEILGRYEEFGLGTALLAREPFVRNMKVKIQNLVQDYGDKIDSQRIEPAKKDEVEKVPSVSSSQVPSVQTNKPNP